MNTNGNLEQLLNELDPLLAKGEQTSDATREDAIWGSVVERANATRPALCWRRPWITFGSLGAAASAAALIVGLWPATAPLSAAAAALTRAAQADAAAVALPSLSSGEYYYQSSSVKQECGFAGPTTPADPSPQFINYITTGTRQTWTNAAGQGEVILTPNPTGVGGSGFASPADQARWIAEGSPFNPCDTASSVGTTPQAGSMTVYGGFGYIFNTPVTQQVAAGMSVINLPSNVETIGQMLAAGEINPDGSTSSTPRVCPQELATPFSTSVPRTSGPVGPTGCSVMQQTELVVQLLQLPDASAKFGSAMYQLLAQMPDASQDGTATVDGKTGNVVNVPFAGLAILSVIIDPTSGALLQTSVNSSEAAQGILTTPVNDAASYGTISVVNGIGTIPTGR